MVVIRLSRGGAKKRPFFNVVVADSRRAAGKLFIERVGFYDPKAPEGRESLRFATDRLRYWRGKGVQGALKIEPFGSGSGSLCKYSAWWVGKPGKLSEVAVAECRAHGAYLVARFRGCDSPEKAGAYRGAEVALKRGDLPEPAEHEF